MRWTLVAIAAFAGASFTSIQPAEAQAKPPARFVQANSSNYTKRHRARRITHVVLHTIEGSATSAQHWFRNRRAKVSAHYIVDFDGSLTQMVRDQDLAWHARGFNTSSIGIEHAGYAGRNQWTDAQYRGSARLTRWLCDTYGIPKDRKHIIGHVEVPRTTHKVDPGRYFNWDYYMRLVRGEAGATPTPIVDADPPASPPPSTGGTTAPGASAARIRALPLSPGAGQTVGLLHTQWREGNATSGYPGLEVSWASSGSAQVAAQVQLEEVGGSLRYDSGRIDGDDTRHRVGAKLQHGKRYRWRVRVTNGARTTATDWTTFSTDFLPAKVTAISPAGGEAVDATPALRWSYDDPDGGSQKSYRIWLDDDADHSTVIGDTKELNGATTSYFLRNRLQPGRTYYWRVMGYDGHGNASFSDWASFQTSADYVHMSGDLSVAARSPKENALVPGRSPIVLSWSYHNGQQREQAGFRVMLERVDSAATERLFDSTYRSPARAFRAPQQEPGNYRWRVGVFDGESVAWTEWAAFQVISRNIGLSGRLPN
jgi:N-acetyl-anhydromuramyl-L-alanine amidase AmpD